MKLRRITVNKLFSIIVVYKDTHKYISESIESVINQNFPLENVEIILVNDESTDNSKEIADFYQERYPNTIKSIDSVGKGISAGKNTGLRYATGEYVNFLDSDDCFQSEVFSSVREFFDENTECEVVAIPMIMFENNRAPHMLNKKFTYSRIIDIKNEPQSIQLSTASAFIKRQAIHESFDESISIGEDTLFLTNLICKTGSFGVVADTYYLYRKRIDNSSTLQNTYENREYYTKFFDVVIEGLYDKFRESDYSEYIENVVSYNLQWPLRKQSYPYSIDKEVVEKFYNNSLNLLMSFKTPKAIQNMKYLSYHQKDYLLRLYDESHGKKLHLLAFNDDIILLNGDSQVDGISKLTVFPVMIEYVDESLVLVFRMASKFRNEDLEKIEFYATYKGKKIIPDIQKERVTKLLGHPIKYYWDFIFEIPQNKIEGSSNFIFYGAFNGVTKKIGLFKRDTVREISRYTKLDYSKKVLKVIQKSSAQKTTLKKAEGNQNKKNSKMMADASNKVNEKEKIEKRALVRRALSKIKRMVNS